MSNFEIFSNDFHLARLTDQYSILRIRIDAPLCHQKCLTALINMEAGLLLSYSVHDVTYRKYPRMPLKGHHCRVLVTLQPLCLKGTHMMSSCLEGKLHLLENGQ